MCFGPLSTVETCPVCRQHHPHDSSEPCIDRQLASLDAELNRYFASPEAAFFRWLSQRTAPPR